MHPKIHKPTLEKKCANLNINDEAATTVQKCKFCTSTFENIKDYLSHLETTHKNKDRGYMCSVCAKIYKTKNELTYHTNSKCGTIKQFKCKICSQELMSAGSLYNHMLRHNGVRSFMCRFCAKLFFTAGQLKVHERIHTKDKAYVCEVCNKGFCHRQSLITHSTLHTGIKPYQCENCGNSFSCVGNLMKHRKTHADTCGLIPLTTHRVNNPSTRIKVKINTPANTRLKTNEKDNEIRKEVDFLKTELCKQETDVNTIYLPYPSKLIEEVNNIEYEENEKKSNDIISNDLNVRREQSIEPPKEEPSSIDKEVSDDDTKYVSDPPSSDEDKGQKENTQKEKRESVAKSRKKRNEDEVELLNFIEATNFDKNGYGECRYCGKRFTYIRCFYKHVKEHEDTIPNVDELESGVRLHKCSCCKMSFHTREENIIHQKANHADILTCQDCEKIFANRDSIRLHRKYFHQGIERKTYLYICDKCGKQFKQKSFLKAHEERNCDPTYECSICKKLFSSVYTRNTHMRVHDPEKKLRCKFCSKRFHWRGQLKIHERSHTGEKPFACLYCPKAFAYRESLITHSSLHTGIKPHLCDGCGSRFSCVGNLIKHKRGHTSKCRG